MSRRARFPYSARPISGESIRRLPDVSVGGPEMTDGQNGQGSKVLTAFLAFCGLVFIIGGTVACGSSPSPSDSVAGASSLVAKAPVTTTSPAVTKSVTGAQTVTTTPSTQAQTTAAARPTTPSAPTHTTPAAPPASSAPATCYPLSNAGHCYEPGEYCRTSDHGTSGVAGDGEAIKCEDVNGWRWEPV